MLTPEQEEIVLAITKGQIALQHKVAYGVVEAFTPATATEGATADVELAVKFRRKVDGVVETYSPQPLRNVPVQYGRVVYPLAVGDEVAIFFCDRGSATAYVRGGTGNEPDGLRRNALSDAFCVPMDWSRAGGAAGHVANALVLDVTDLSEIRLGKNASLGVARETDEVMPLAAWASFFTAVGAATGVAVPGGTFALITTSSSKVKAE